MTDETEIVDVTNTQHDESFQSERVRRHFREAAGRFATGLAVLSLKSASRTLGITCQSFVSASLDPPLVAAFIHKDSKTLPPLRKASRFVANILSESQIDEANAFAAATRHEMSFTGLAHTSFGTPFLPRCIAWLECSRYDELPAGDHVVILGYVHDLEMVNPLSPPLCYFASTFRSIGQIPDRGSARSF